MRLSGENPLNATAIPAPHRGLARGRLDLAAPSPGALASLVERFLAEDLGRGDVTSQAVVPSGLRGEARIEARQGVVVAGLGVARACFEVASGGAIGWSAHLADGSRAEAGQRLATVEGELRALLGAERTALNLLGRLSGVATLTSRFVERVAETPVRIVDTRKTTPGLRLLEKYAVRMGGGFNHRFGLDDGVLIKDNHIAAAGSVTKAVQSARRLVRFGLLVEVEVSDLAELDDALAAGADAVLLDNMTPELAEDAVARAGGKVLVEASGGITLANVRAFAQAGVDLISVGALTHSAPSADVALEVSRTCS